MSSIQLRALNREDFARVRALYSATKNRLRAEAYDAWCFFDTPWGDAIAVIAVESCKSSSVMYASRVASLAKIC